MTREVDLVSYLPPFMAEYQEDKVTLTAENPEFHLLWEAADRVLNNEFILTADEYGISRFEQLLKIYPNDTDTLEIRRLRVLAAWSKKLPYTLPWLREWMGVLCGGSDGHEETVKDYILSVNLDENILPNMNDLIGIILELLPGVIPANLFLELTRLWTAAERTVYIGAYTAVKEMLEIWPELASGLEIRGTISTSGIEKISGKIQVYPKLAVQTECTVKEETCNLAFSPQMIEIYPE